MAGIEATKPAVATSPRSFAMKIVRLAEVTSFPVERHVWGQFVYSLFGSLELTIRASRFAAPPNFGLWLPPDTDHVASGYEGTTYVLLDIERSLCAVLPDRPTILAVSPVAKSILLDLEKRDIREPGSPEDARMLQVLMDQLRIGDCLEAAIPMSNEPSLKRILEGLISNPADGRSLAEWARHVHGTERTLARHCKRDLGMTFHQWRQRLRVSRAIALLSDGLSVQMVAAKLGYNSSSAFIVMFQEATGFTPNAFRGCLPDRNELRRIGGIRRALPQSRD